MAATVEVAKERGRWSPATRAKALDLYVELGPTEAARRLGPGGPDKTAITKWAKAAGIACKADERTEAATRAAAANWRFVRAQLADEFGAAGVEALEAARVAVRRGEASDAKQYMLVSAIAVDKGDKLAGIAPEPTQHHHLITLEEVEAEIARLNGGAYVTDVDSWEVDDDDEQGSIGTGDGGR